MVPSINAMQKSAAQLQLCMEESLIAAESYARLGLPLKAKAYQGQAHDFAQVIVMLLEQVKARTISKKAKKYDSARRTSTGSGSVHGSDSKEPREATGNRKGAAGAI